MIDISQIYKKAFEIVKKNKWLWVFGMALVAFSGGGVGNFNFRGSGDSFKSLSSYYNGQMFGYFKDLFSSIPVSLYISLGIGIFVLIIIGLVISLVVGSWAKAAAIGAINDGYNNKPVSLKSGSDHGIKNFKNIIWLTIVPWLLYTFALIGTGAILSLFIIFTDGPIRILPILLASIAAIVAVIASLGISASQIWAQRVVVLEGKSGKEAFKEGWKIAKKHFGNMAILGCVNGLLSCCFGVIIIGTIGGLVFSGIGLMALNKNIGIVFLFIVGILGLGLLLIGTLVGGILKIFNYATWNILYRQIRDLPAARLPDGQGRQEGKLNE